MTTRLLTPLLILLLGANGAAGGAYTRFYVFGDSLSDVGNVYDNTFGITPNSAYWEGRFTNGPVYSELLGEGLGLGPVRHSGDGGDNYAHGNAKTTGTPFFLSFLIDDLDDQVDDFIRRRTADPEALHVVFAAANDFFDGQSNVQVPANNIQADLTRLLNHGARQFLVINLPLLGLTPEYNSDPMVAATYTGRSVSFNAALEANIQGLEAAYGDATFHRLDLAGLFSSLTEAPELFGLSNVTDPAAPGLEATGSASGVSIVPNPDEYLFWDTVHPTRVGHQLLSQAALRAVSRPGDFNFDGLVDAADYQVWRVAYGTADLGVDSNGDLIVDAADYTVWRDNLDAASAMSGPVPAPTGLSALLLTSWIACCCRTQRKT